MSEISKPTAVPTPAAPAASTFGRSATSGWIVFAGTMIAIAGALNAIDGFVGLYRTRYFSNTFVFGNLREWSIAFLIIGVLQVLAGLGIMARQGWARWFGLAMVSINAFLQLSVISTYPLYASLIIAYDIAIFYALTVHWQRRAAA